MLQAAGPQVVAIGGGSVVAALAFERTAESVGSARLAVEDVLAESGVGDRDVVDAAVLLVSELGTDALQHGRGPLFHVTVTLDRTTVQVSVETPAALPRAAAAAPARSCEAVGAAAALAPVGVVASGLAPHSRTVVEMVADTWDVRATPATRTAWFRLFR